ncbi:hypothetical protein AA313_de0210083 [Arthrobotrys entomopaga]|nr:hypothetical protein AA313_de0210083 [Arthrobotrys entomopaga]
MGGIEQLYLSIERGGEVKPRARYLSFAYLSAFYYCYIYLIHASGTNTYTYSSHVQLEIQIYFQKPQVHSGDFPNTIPMFCSCICKLKTFSVASVHATAHCPANIASCVFDSVLK